MGGQSTLLTVLASIEMIGWLAIPSWSLTSSATTSARPDQVWAWYEDTRDWPHRDHLVDKVDARRVSR